MELQTIQHHGGNFIPLPIREGLSKGYIALFIKAEDIGKWAMYHVDRRHLTTEQIEIAEANSKVLFPKTDDT